MAFLTESDVRSRAKTQVQNIALEKAVFLDEARKNEDTKFDIFLSHSSDEPEDILLGIVAYLEEDGLSVYVDKYVDPDLSPNKVTLATAETLRKRLSASSALLYVYSRYSIMSRWMPWELGFMDGAGKKVGIFPVVQTSASTFRREAYLGLYPYVDRAGLKQTQKKQLWINRSGDNYTGLEAWVHGRNEIP